MGLTSQESPGGYKVVILGLQKLPSTQQGLDVHLLPSRPPVVLPRGIKALLWDTLAPLAGRRRGGDRRAPVGEPATARSQCAALHTWRATRLLQHC